MYIRHSSRSKSESPSLIRPSPPLQRPSSDILLNVNTNAIIPDPASLQRTDSQLMQRADSQLMQRADSHLIHRTNSAEIHRNNPPLLKRNRTAADDYLKNLNFHHEYQGRRGHMKVNTVHADPPIR